MKHVWVITCVIAMLGCGGEEKPPYAQPPEKDRDGSTDERPDDRDSGPRDSGELDSGEIDSSVNDSGPNDSGADSGMVVDAGRHGPSLEFRSPPPTEDPNSESVLTTTMVTTRCRVTRHPEGGVVDNSSVAIAMDKVTGGADRIKGAVKALPDSEFEANFELGAMPNGPVRFHCQAKDLSMPSTSSSMSMTTLLDLGPKIEVLKPTDKMNYALKTPVAIEFQVDPVPIAAGDAKAAVKNVALLVSGQSITATESSQTKGRYQASVNFGDKALFEVPPSTAEIVVSASNERAPHAPTRTVKLDIGVDGKGPTISVTSPKDLSMQHGEVTLVVSITDASGVNSDSVRAVVLGALPGGDDLVIETWNRAGATYSQKFDTGSFEETLNEVTINIYATDTVGNMERKDHQLRLDNRPPVLSLDPPLLREWKPDGDGYRCSVPFDPVGDFASNDLETVESAAMYRVLVEDRTNRDPGALFAYQAGVANDKVRLYAQGDPSIPFMIDGNGDGQCDEVALEGLPLAQRPALLTMTALPPRGTSWFTQAQISVVNNAACSAAADTKASAPSDLCESDMPRIVSGQLPTPVPAVFAVNPTPGTNTGPCTGNTWTIGGDLGEGWACVAARAEDTIGNVGVSEPIRVCVDDGKAPPPPCAAGQPEENSPPSCLHNCQFDDTQRFSTGQIWKLQ